MNVALLTILDRPNVTHDCSYAILVVEFRKFLLELGCMILGLSLGGLTRPIALHRSLISRARTWRRHRDCLGLKHVEGWVAVGRMLRKRLFRISDVQYWKGVSTRDE